MVKKLAGRTYCEINFFDGIYEVTRRCFVLPECGLFRIEDEQDGEIWQVTKGYKDHVSYYFDTNTAVDIMAETGNMDEIDRLWIINHGNVCKVAKVCLSSVYGESVR